MWSSSLVIVFLFIRLFTTEIPSEFESKVVGVKDGDTYVVLYQDYAYTLRLAHIDCPEKNQPFGKNAKQYGSQFCFGKTVLVKKEEKTDRNGRWIGEIVVEGKSLNQSLVYNGLAWHFKKYSKSKLYHQLEQDARVTKKGLWVDPNAIAPWEWRKQKHSF
jgi:micrococcal nuclease